MGRINTEEADNPVVSSGYEAKEGDGLRRSIRKRKAVERYQAEVENLKYMPTSSKHTSTVRERDSCKKPKRPLSVNSQKDNLNKVPGTSHKNHMEIGASLANVKTTQSGRSVLFDGVGGLSEHISDLKEMIILPLLYPDVFKIMNLTQLPRGCLFCGPPGTGKTLVARALANECSRGDKKVTFFTRSAADCMSKWIGESERELRLLFEQAYEKRPSIIFFDEIDALAPVRSSKQDQVHSSIVGTLLALMDGVASRGEVVVIGATNRLDSIDPALRRPGRFEREFHFKLPNKEARKEIFKIHTRDWILQPLDNLLEELAEKCVGYCGADISALCVEAGLCALRRHYPQIRESDKRLRVDATSVKVTAHDFAMAMQKIVPASQRAGASPGRALPSISKPLLENTLERILQALQRAFPHAELALKKDQGNDLINNVEGSLSVSGKMPTHKMSQSKKAELHTFSSNPPYQPTSFRPRFLIVEEPGSGQGSELASAVIHALEKFPTYMLDLSNLFVSSTSQEETCSKLIREAQRTAPSIIYIPQIPLWWEAVGPTLKAGFTGLLNHIPTFAPVLVLATSDVQHEDLPEEIKALFSNNHEVFNIPPPTRDERRGFFEDLIMKQAAEPPASNPNAGSQVHCVTHARCSQVDEQPQVCDSKATQIHSQGVFVDYSELEKTCFLNMGAMELAACTREALWNLPEVNKQVLDSIVKATKNVSISSMGKLYSVLSRCIYQHRDDADKTELVMEMKKEIEAFHRL